MSERTFDYGGMLDELRCHSTESVELARLEAVAEHRRPWAPVTLGTLLLNSY
jgi:hypothetical protein